MNLTQTAKYTSYLFIPPVMNLFIFSLLSFKIENSINIFYGILISFLFGLILPVIAIIYFRSKGILSNNDATIKEERTIPYIWAVFFSLFGLVLSSILELNSILIMLWMVYLVNSILILNINRFWKISAHTMGIGMPLGALFFIGDIFWIAISIIILIVVGAARLILKVHTFLQVMAGSILGFSVAYILLNYILKN